MSSQKYGWMWWEGGCTWRKGREMMCWGGWMCREGDGYGGRWKISQIYTLLVCSGGLDVYNS